MKTNQTTFNQATLITLLSTKTDFNLAKIAEFCNTEAFIASHYRRLQRFMKEFTLPPDKLAPLLLHIMEIDPKDNDALL